MTTAIQQKTEPVEIITRANAFNTETERDYRFLVDGDSVLVWDSVADHFTTCHSLNNREIRRIRQMAADAA